jgi:hypothetical protein
MSFYASLQTFLKGPQMTIDLEQYLHLDLDFPGIPSESEAWALKTYLSVLKEQVSHARDQYKVRGEHRLEKMRGRLGHDEYWEMSSQIENAADRQIPRFFFNGALLLIWGLFESSLTDFAAYVGGRENTGLPFRDVRASNFRQQVERYFEEMHRIQLPWSAQEREGLRQLQELRNFISHRNGRLSDLPAKNEHDIKLLVDKLDDVEIVEGRIAISPNYIDHAANLVFSLIDRFSQQIADRYAPR